MDGTTMKKIKMFVIRERVHDVETEKSVTNILGMFMQKWEAQNYLNGKLEDYYGYNLIDYDIHHEKTNNSIVVKNPEICSVFIYDITEEEIIMEG